MEEIYNKNAHKGERINTIETTALISDFTPQDRLNLLNSQYYILPKIEIDKEESKKWRRRP